MSFNAQSWRNGEFSPRARRSRRGARARLRAWRRKPVGIGDRARASMSRAPSRDGRVQTTAEVRDQLRGPRELRQRPRAHSRRAAVETTFELGRHFFEALGPFSWRRATSRIAPPAPAARCQLSCTSTSARWRSPTAFATAWGSCRSRSGTTPERRHQAVDHGGPVAETPAASASSKKVSSKGLRFDGSAANVFATAWIAFAVARASKTGIHTRRTPQRRRRGKRRDETVFASRARPSPSHARRISRPRTSRAPSRRARRRARGRATRACRSSGTFRTARRHSAAARVLFLCFTSSTRAELSERFDRRLLVAFIISVA